jgi:hypothetical protein
MDEKICFLGIYFSGNHEQFRERRTPTSLADLYRSWVPVASHPIYYALEQDQEGILEKFFDYFNWQHSNHGEFGYAGKQINSLCVEHGCHASMSVGDVLMIVSESETEFYFVEPFTWKKLELK